MNRTHLLLLWLFGCLCATALHAQPLTYRQLGMEQGLFNNQARLVWEMADGRILVATDGMFNLYDGTRFEPLECDLSRTYSLASFTDLYQAVQQGPLLWVKDHYNLYLLDLRTGRFLYDVKERLAPACVEAPLKNLFIDEEGTAWLLTDRGKLYRFDWHHPATLLYNPTPQEQKEGIAAMRVCSSGHFHFVLFSNGLLRCWEDSSQQWVLQEGRNLSPNTLYREILALRWDSRRMLFAFDGDRPKLMAYDIYAHTWHTVDSALSVTSMRRVGSSLAVTGNEGCRTYDSSFHLLHQENTFGLDDGHTLQEHIMSEIIDRQGGRWLCTYSSGVLYSHPARRIAITYANDRQGSESRRIRCMQTYDSRTLLVGTGEGIYLFDLPTRSFTPLSSQTAGMLCFNMERDHSGRLWVSTQKGLLCVKGKELRLYNSSNVRGLEGDYVRACCELSPDTFLVCSRLNHPGLFIPSTALFMDLTPSIPVLGRYRTISNMRPLPGGSLVSVNTQNGTFLLNRHNRTLTPLTAAGTFSNKFNCQMVDSCNQLWIGTQNGLLRVDWHTGRLLAHYTTDNGLPNNCIQALLEDASHNLWVSTSYGIAMAPAADRTREPLHFMAFGPQDGVQSCELYERSSLQAGDGSLCFGGLEGLTLINSSSLPTQRQSLKPAFIQCTVMGEKVARDGTLGGRIVVQQYDSVKGMEVLHLAHNQNYVDFSFSALNYISPQRTWYRYRMKGLDKQWIYSRPADGMGHASYTSLPSGHYTLVVQAAVQDGEWGMPLTLDVVIATPLWRSAWALLAYLLAVLALVYYFIRLYVAAQRARLLVEQEEKRHQEEQRLDELKFRFFTNISHELRTPLTLIITPLEMLLKRVKDEGERHELERIGRNAQELLALVNQLLDFRRLSGQGEALHPQPLQVESFCRDCYEPFVHLSQERNIHYEYLCDFGNNELFVMDGVKVKKIIANLLSNAFKFTPDGGRITLLAEKQPNGSLLLQVTDTGMGIPREELSTIFDRFVQSSNHSPNSSLYNTGSGIGLNLVKGYVELHHGRVEVTSEVGKGSVFSIYLPAGLALPQGDAPQLAGEIETKEEELPSGAPAREEKAVTLLLVEDNREFREFLCETLSPLYHLLQAADGAEGLDMARSGEPDLVVSDVMMPRMDGIELCRQLKSNLSTSHIPVILLTARSSNSGEAGAYEAGADSYLSKPFNMDVLLARIRQLIAQQRARQESFRHTVDINPKEIVITHLDEQLMQHALDCMEKHMDDADYSVELLSRDMAIDRTHLYRKLQAIVGLTPSEFMRSVRLKRAARLLSEGGYQVSEVCWMVGFNTPRYFSAYFREMFGVTPSQYKENNKQ